jgi:hypothetical protein
MQGENDNHSVAGMTVFHPSPLTLFLPALTIAAGYAVLYAWMALTGLLHIGLAWICLAALFIGVPCLAVYCGLRLLTVRLRLLKHGLLVQEGFPQFDAVGVAYDNIDAIRVERGFSGRVGGGGTLVFDLTDGRKVTAPSLARPFEVKSAIERQIAGAWCADIATRPLGPDISASSAITG